MTVPMEINSAGWKVGDLTIFGAGRVMRVTAIGEIRPDIATLVSAADADEQSEYDLTTTLQRPPTGADMITCMGCLRNTHLWIDATHTNRWSGRRLRLIRCSRCYADALYVQDCEVHTTSSTIRPSDLERRR
jgi:hypothetical protein